MPEGDPDGTTYLDFLSAFLCMRCINEGKLNDLNGAI